MSRPVAGVRNSTLILTLPGSPKGAKENLEAVIKLLPHACQQAAGFDSRVAHQNGTGKLEKDAGIAVSPHSQFHNHSHHHDHSHGHGYHHGPKSHTSNDPNLGPAQRSRQSPYPLLAVPDALSLISQHTPSPVKQKHEVDQSLLSYVLATDVQAVESVPAFRASIVDGYAVKCNTETNTNSKGTYTVAFAAHAEAGPEKQLGEGEVARITTGAALPTGAHAVVMVEDTHIASIKSTSSGHKEEESIEILTDVVRSGENVREVGSDVKEGSIIMRAGEGVSTTGGEFGLLASVGVKEVEVWRKPVVGVLSTGDEIVPHGYQEALQPGQVRDTNRPTLLSAVRAQGFDAIDLGIAKDKSEHLESTLRNALGKVDVLITSGGVSMGELDLLKPTIERALGGDIHFGRVAMKPGKPTTFATVGASSIKDPTSGQRATTTGDRFGSKIIFSLPGNPASAVVTFMLFVLPSLHKMSGVEPRGLPKVMAKVDGELKCDETREEYQRVSVDMKVVNGKAELWASSTGGQRSSRIGSFKGANGLAKLKPGGGTVGKGDLVECLLMDNVRGIVERR